MRHLVSRISNVSTQLNNAAANSIANGNYIQASKYLASALEACRSNVTSTNKSNLAEDVQGCRSDKCCQYVTTGNNGNSIIDEWMDLPEQSTQEVDADSGNFLYKKPVYIPETIVKTTEDNDEISLLHSIAISFNLGLTYQFLALTETRNKQFVLMEKALKFFQLSLKMYTIKYTRTSDSPLFFMASMNNIGVIYQILGETECTKKCFQRLLSLQMYITSTHGGILEFQCFFCNAARFTHDAISIGAGAA